MTRNTMHLLGIAAALGIGAAHGQVTLSPSSQTQPWGIAPTLAAQATCAFQGSTLYLDEVSRGVVTSISPIINACPAVSPTPIASMTFDTSSLVYGPLSTRVFTARTDVMPSSAPVTTAAAPDLYLPFTSDTILFASGKSPTFSRCAQSQGVQLDREGSFNPPLPPNIRTPFEMTAVSLAGCTFGTQDAGSYGFAGKHLTPAVIGHPGDLPPNAELFVLDGRSSAWAPVARCAGPANCAANTAFSNTVGRDMWFGFVGDTGSSVRASAAIAYPQLDARDLPLQDLWWGGGDENGWGLNIAKNDQNLFATLYFYKADGTPVWAVLPSGQWDPVHNVWYGNLYQPTASAFTAYDTKQFDPGNPVGTLSISFDSPESGHIDYFITGSQGGKRIQRYLFAPRATDPPPYSGMWWGGAAQDGWGLSVQQQGETLFVTWYTYDAQGNVTWFVMPAATRTAAGKYSGALYRTTGSQWTGKRNFDGSKTRVFAVGTMDLTFADSSTATMKAVVNGVTITQPIARFGF